MLNHYLSILILFAIWPNFLLFGQINYEDNLDKAFEQSRIQNKNLLIIRYNQVSINGNENHSYSSDDYVLDSLLKDTSIINYIKSNFIVYHLNNESNQNSDILFYSQFFCNYTPNLILFTPDSSLIDFKNSISFEFKIENLLSLLDTIQSKKEDLRIRLTLEDKFKKNNISDHELFQLITLRNELNIKSVEYYNQYALRKAELNSEFAKNNLNQDFKTTDTMVPYFLESNKPNDESWDYYKVALIGSILERAKSNTDKSEFEKATFLFEEHANKLMKSQAEKYPQWSKLDPANNQIILDENNLEDRFNYYLSISDTSNIIKSGKKFALFLYQSYNKKLKQYLNLFLDENFNMLKLVPYDSDLERLAADQKYLNNKPILIENETNKYNERVAKNLNEISWSYYKYSKNNHELKDALTWSKFSLKLNSTSEKLDTYAHLLFKLGHQKKALKYQNMAIQMAQQEGKYTEYIDGLKTELNKYNNK